MFVSDLNETANFLNIFTYKTLWVYNREGKPNIYTATKILLLHNIAYLFLYYEYQKRMSFIAPRLQSLLRKKKKKKNQSRETKFSNNSRSLRVSRQDSCSLKFNSIMDGRRDTNQAEGVDVVVQFYPWFKFYFLLFWGTVIYDSEFETEENIIWTKDKIEPQHRHWTHLRANSITNSMVSIDKQR